MITRKNVLTILLAGVITLSSGLVVYAETAPSGTVWYNGQAIEVTDGVFKINGVSGTIDAQGNYSIGGTTGNILNTAGVTSYQITGSTAVVVNVGTSGTVRLTDGRVIQVTNGKFTFDGKSGTVDAKGNFVINNTQMFGSNETTGNLLTTEGIAGYQLAGQAYVPVKIGTTGTVTYLGKNIQVTNGWFTMGGSTGSIDAQGNYVITDSNGVKTTGNIATTPGVNGYQLDGKSYVTLTASGANNITQAWLDAWMRTHPGAKSTWGQSVYDAAVTDWIAQNPNLTAAQIVDNMMKWNINVTQMALATNKSVPTLMKMANEAGITNEQLYKAGLTGMPFSVADGNNLYWAATAGWIPIGVMYAHSAMNGSSGDPSMAYSAADMQMAIYYQKNGYWGPDGSGDILTQLTKAGLIKDFKYIGPSILNNGQVTGPNIYVAPTSTVDFVPTVLNYAPTVAGTNIFSVKFSFANFVANKRGFNECPSAIGYTIDFGDNSVATTTMLTSIVNGSSTGATWFCNGYTVNHTYQTAGTYTVKLSRQVPYICPTDGTSCDNAKKASVTLIGTKAVVVPISASQIQSTTQGVVNQAIIDDSESTIDSCVVIPTVLRYQSRDAETNGFVTKLQNFLHATNYLSSQATGFFGAGTFKAVKAFQRANGISQTGQTGPNTRAKIKEISCAMPAATLTDSSVTLSDTTTGVLPAGCTATSLFSSTTGIKCAFAMLPEGCTLNTAFSPLTGIRCVAQ